ncbi:hypothetical protein R83H12_01204 [Fibrobacteria bacterium R8-3-H12]
MAVLLECSSIIASEDDMDMITLFAVCLLAYILIRHIGFFAVGISLAVATGIYLCSGGGL